MTLTNWGETDYTVDPSVAFKSLDNLTRANIPAINYKNYTKITNFTNVSFHDPAQSAKALSTPVNEVLIPVWGYWLYILIIFYLTMVVYSKTETIGAASITLMLLSALCVGPSLVGVYTIPANIATIMYTLAGLGLAGSLLSWIIEG